MKCFGLIALLTSAVLAAQTPVPPADGFTPLFDGKSLAGWTPVNANVPGPFTVKEGLLRIEGRSGWLKSEKQYADFDLRVEVRFLTDDADSGVFVRAVGDTIFMRGWPGSSYQVQARDVTRNQSANPVLIGNIYRHGNPGGQTTFDSPAALRVAKKTNEWQLLEIEVRGDTLAVTLNGTPLTRATGLVNASGYLGVQSEAGVVEYRSILIREKAKDEKK